MTATPFPPIPVVRDPGPTPAGIATELRRILAESEPYWAAYDTPAFFHRPQPDVWAPVDQVRHLTKSVGALGKGLAIPRMMLLLRFGPAFRASRTLETIRTAYSTALAARPILLRRNPFAPRALAADEATEGNRRTTMERHAEAVTRLAASVERWPPHALNRYRLPHPLLGKLTVREMLVFTLIHNVHHVQVAERRRLGLLQGGEPPG